MENISPHISYTEAVRSAVAERNGIQNVPGAAELSAMKRIAGKIFEPLRVAMGNVPIRVSSFFRCLAVEKAAKRNGKSQHVKGQAMDICRLPNSPYTNADLFNWIKNNVEFDQLIWEGGTETEPEWIHVSLKPTGNRRQILYL